MNELNKDIDAVIMANPTLVADYRSGVRSAIGALLGKYMAAYKVGNLLDVQRDIVRRLLDSDTETLSAPVSLWDKDTGERIA